MLTKLSLLLLFHDFLLLQGLNPILQTFVHSRGIDWRVRLLLSLLHTIGAIRRMLVWMVMAMGMRRMWMRVRLCIRVVRGWTGSCRGGHRRSRACRRWFGYSCIGITSCSICSRVGAVHAGNDIEFPDVCDTLCIRTSSDAGNTRGQELNVSDRGVETAEYRADKPVDHRQVMKKAGSRSRFVDVAVVGEYTRD